MPSIRRKSVSPANRQFVVFESLANLTGEKPMVFPNDPTIFWARSDGSQKRSA